MPNRYVSNSAGAPAWASGRLPRSEKEPAPMRNDAFGNAPPAPPATPLVPSAPATGQKPPAPPPAPGNASPPAAQVNTGNPPPAPVSASAPALAASQVPPPPPAPAQTKADGLKPAPAQPDATKEGHMPKVGTVTAGNPTGDPRLDNDGNPRPGGNEATPERDALRAKLTETVTSLGRTKGAGANSRGELAVVICQAARDGIISVEKKSTDVADIYDAFTKAQKSAQLDDAHLERDPKNVATAVSKLALFAKLGAVDTKFDTAKLMSRARDIVPKVKGAKVTTFDALRVVAKAQLVALKTDPKSKLLTDAQIKALLAPEDDPEDDKTNAEYELVELEAIVKRMLKLQDGTAERGPSPSDELQRAIAVLVSRKALVAKIVEREQDTGEEAA